jgi:hypothetical protein
LRKISIRCLNLPNILKKNLIDIDKKNDPMRYTGVLREREREKKTTTTESEKSLSLRVQFNQTQTRNIQQK